MDVGADIWNGHPPAGPYSGCEGMSGDEHYDATSAEVVAELSSSGTHLRISTSSSVTLGGEKEEEYDPFGHGYDLG